MEGGIAPDVSRIYDQPLNPEQSATQTTHKIFLTFKPKASLTRRVLPALPERERMTRDDDASLAVDAAHGDETAFTVLFNRYNEQVIRQSLQQLGGDWSAAEDVAQITWTQVYSEIHHFDPNRRPFAAWLHTIRISRCLNYIRDQKRFPRPATDVGGYAEPIGRPSHEASVDVTEQLPPDLATAVRVVYLEDRSFPEAAEILGCSVGTVHKRVVTGLRILRKIMGVEVAQPTRRTQVRTKPKPIAVAETARDIQMLVA